MVRILATATFLSASAPLSAVAQSPQPPTSAQPSAQAPPTSIKPETKSAPKANEITLGGPVQADSLRAQREAAKFYLQGVKLLEKQQPERAWSLLRQAAELEPGNVTYARAAELARQSTVTQLVQQASREKDQSPDRVANRTVDDAADEPPAKLLEHALAIDPTSPFVLQHLNTMADAAASSPVGVTSTPAPGSIIGEKEASLAGTIRLEPSAEKHSFHSKSTARQLVEAVFRAYGIQVTMHDSVQSKLVRLDTDDVSFADAMRLLALVTHTFYEPLDPRRVIVAQDTRENRTQFQRQQMETIYLPGLTDKQLTDVGNLARNVFDAQRVVPEPSKGTLTVQAPARTMDAFNRTISDLEQGSDQVDLDVKVIQLSHVSARETGTTFFQQTGVYNTFAELNTILSQNQSAVQQIISSGLVPNANGLTNELTIVGILLAAGQLTGAPFNEGIALFGGGLTSSLLTVSPATLTLSLNSSDTRTLEDIHLRLSDDEAGTFKIGERYPIETSAYSSSGISAVSALSALGGAATTTQTIPQIQYEDLGLTMKATPKVMRSSDVALTMEIKIESLGGASLNNIPILDSQQFTGVLTMRAGETAILLSDLSRQESRALSGLPGISDIPGLQDISDIQKNQNVAKLLILITPTVVREGTRQLAHGPVLRLDKTQPAH